jgi:hypothetical protein
MLMVVTGAGASYGCIDDANLDAVDSLDFQSSRIPIANQLFALNNQNRSVAIFYPELRGLATEIRTALLRDPDLTVEDELALLAERSDQETTRQLLAMRFYLKDLIGSRQAECARLLVQGGTYDALVARLRRWRSESSEPVLYATFNYDTLLDSAIEAGERVQFTRLGDYVAQNQVQLYKLHGSISWVRQATCNYPPPSAVGRALDPLFAREHAELLEPPSDSFQMASQVQAGPRYVWLPAIAVPVARKTEFECPSAHIEALSSRLPEVTRLLVVGWRGRDAHFVQLLRERLRPGRLKVLVADAQETGETGRHLNLALSVPGLQTEWPGGQDVERSFSDLIRSEALEKLLSP